MKVKKEKVGFKEVFVDWEGSRYYLKIHYHTEGGGPAIEVGCTRQIGASTSHSIVYWRDALKNLEKLKINPIYEKAK